MESAGCLARMLASPPGRVAVRQWGCRVAVAATAILLFAGSGEGQAERPEALGADAYRWQLVGLRGDTTSLGAWRGKVVVLNLWATWCRVCITELPSLMALRDSLRGTDAVVLAVSAESAERVRGFVAKRRIDLPVYLEWSPMPKSLGVLALPTTLVIDREGRIVLRHQGLADWGRPEIVEFVREVAGRE